MSLARSRMDWEEMGTLDPCWAILSQPEKRNGRWELADFLATGETEIAQVMRQAEQFGFPKRHDRALDFGCGMGRLTWALAHHFDHVTGIDISRPMVFRATALNRTGNCAFTVSNSAALPFTSQTFDLVLSAIVLQHVPDRRAIRNYIAEFSRVVRPGGLIVMQLPNHIPLRRRLQARRRLYAWLRALGISEVVLYNQLRLHPIPMHHLPEDEVRSIFASGQCRVVKSVSDGRAGAHIESRTYYVTKE